MARVQLKSSKWVKITGIKSAIGDFNKWLAYDWRRSANIMIDKSNGKIWTDTFIDRNSWNDYHDNDIVSLSHYITCRTGEKITMELLKIYAIDLLSE